MTTANLIDIKTRRNHPETNGKIEGWNGLLRQEALRKDYQVTNSYAERIIAKIIIIMRGFIPVSYSRSYIPQAGSMLHKLCWLKLSLPQMSLKIHHY